MKIFKIEIKKGAEIHVCEFVIFLVKQSIDRENQTVSL